MTVDKEHLDQPASKSAIFTPPSLTNFGDPMSAPTRTGNRPDADQPVAKSKLILPTAIWVLIVVGSLCFLSLLASLNKSINTLDSLVEIEQASAGKRRGEAPDSPSSKFGDLISLPSWLSLDRPSTREPSVEGIIITGGGPLPLGLDNQLGEPSDPVAAMVRDLFGAGPAADQAYDQLPAEPAPSSLIDKININRLNININPKPQSDHGAERTQMLAQRRPFRPQEFAGPDSLGPNRMLDDMLIKMIGAPLDEQRREPVPMSPLAQLHLMPFEPELSREGMRPHSQLDSSIPPMFGRPNGEAHIVITQIGGPEPDSGASPVETSSTERPSTNESSTLGDLVTPEPIVAVQQPVTSQPEEADDEPRRGANRVTDLFKMFFGPPPTTKFFAMPPYVEKFEEKPSNANEAEINEALKETIEPKVTTTAASTDGSPMEQLFDGLLGGTISLPQMASEQPAIKVGSADGKEIPSEPVLSSEQFDEDEQ